MNQRRLLKHSLTGTLGLAVLVLALPGLVYITSLAKLPKFPSPPAASIIDEHSKHAWAVAGGGGLYLGSYTNVPMAMERLDPWSITWHLLVRCKRNTGHSSDLHFCAYYYRGYLPAITAAGRHFEEIGYKDAQSLWQAISQVALAVWITRHWSSEQVAKYLSSTEKPQ